jgi:multiple sugar transport system substrate-binding protein
MLILSRCQNSTALSAKNSGIIKLTLWHGINPPPNRDVFQTLTEKFNKTHPHIQVEALYIGQPDQQLPKIMTAIVRNAPQIYFGILPQWQEN